MLVLVVNCGSSSIKFQLFDMPDQKVVAKGLVDRIGNEKSALIYEHNGEKVTLEQPAPDHDAGMELIIDALINPDGGVIKDIAEIKAVGHRVVHGGEAFTGSVVINDEVIASIEKVADLAPLHNPPNLTGIRAAQHAMPDVPQIACFDTAFHTTIPEVAYMYALPYELYEKYGIRRYGFHGTSHRWVARKAAEMMGWHKYDINCITCHLGNGSSIAAVRNGKSIDTSMGLTPLEGVPMGTRTGDFDPAILFYLADKGYTVEDLNKLCNKQSGVLGLSGTSNDMRTLTEKAKQGDERAQLALDVFAYRIKKYIGAYSAVLGSLDAIVFTGGIGENAPETRAAICSNLKQIGVELDMDVNQSAKGASKISSDDSAVAVLVIPTNEEAAIAIDTYEMSQACLKG